MRLKCLPVALLFVCCVYVVTCPTVNAQTPAADQGFQIEEFHRSVKHLFLSSNLRDLAWAAQMSGQYGMYQHVPELLELLDSMSAADEQQHLVLLNVLDALIQLDAQPQARSLRALVADFPEQVLVLVAKSSVPDQFFLFDLLPRAMPEICWRAVCNLLAADRAPGFAALIARDLKISVSATVTDQDGGTGSGGSFGCGGGRQVADGFPPTASYSLFTKGRIGNILLAPGRTPIYYSREIAMPGDYVRGTTRVYWNNWMQNSRARLDVLNDLSGGTGLEDWYYRHFVRKPTGEIAAELQSIVDRAATAYRHVVERLVESGMISPVEAKTLRPCITVEIQDQRQNKSEPLLKIVIP